MSERGALRVTDIAADPATAVTAGFFERHPACRSSASEWTVDVLVYTSDEAAAWSPRFRGEVERGIVLYRRDGASPSR
jgi:hypothetical protein